MFKPVRLPNEVEVASQLISLRVRKLRKSKNLRLRYDGLVHRIIITSPIWVRNRDILAFLRKHQAWLEGQVSKCAVVPFASGIEIPYRGGVRLLRYDSGFGSKIFDDGEVLVCGGGEDRFSSRVDLFLRSRARGLLAQLSSEYALLIGCDYQRIRIGDARSCWGSCSSRGTLSFNWRLVLLDDSLSSYVALHEVCHLRHMDHSSDFWNLVECFMPDYRERRLSLRQQEKFVRSFGGVSTIRNE